jgi:hypothetical protein
VSALQCLAILCVWQGLQCTLLLPRTRAVFEWLASLPDRVLQRVGMAFLGLAAVFSLVSI